MRIIFEKVQSFHTQMMLNPFFDFDSHGSLTTAPGNSSTRTGRSLNMADEDVGSDYSSSSCSSCNSSNNDQSAASQPAKPADLNSKLMNDEWLQSLERRIDNFVSQCDINLRGK